MKMKTQCLWNLCGLEILMVKGRKREGCGGGGGCLGECGVLEFSLDF